MVAMVRMGMGLHMGVMASTMGTAMHNRDMDMPHSRMGITSRMGMVSRDGVRTATAARCTMVSTIASMSRSMYPPCQSTALGTIWGSSCPEQLQVHHRTGRTAGPSACRMAMER